MKQRDKVCEVCNFGMQVYAGVTKPVQKFMQ